MSLAFKLCFWDVRGYSIQPLKPRLNWIFIESGELHCSTLGGLSPVSWMPLSTVE
uniref:Uncharacterized protein n=1 Tax=Zea mays TaxID=4577 RepID=B7ZZD2_MAIZE|nr:unknown [Zea mays]